jgi:hypothetical protein
MADFDVEVFINGQSAGRSRNDGDPVLDFVNRLLHAGANEVRVVARKIARDHRRSESSAHQHRVLFGEGSEQNGQITIQTNLVDYAVNASQPGDQTAVFTVTVR